MNTRKILKAMCVWSWLLLFVNVSSHAQSMNINWFTLDSGGGTSTAGAFTVRGTIGQPDAGTPMAGGSFALTGGFWPLLAAPEANAPQLTIRLTRANTLQVLWPSSLTGFTLQQNTDLNSANWVAAPQPVFDDGTNQFILVSPTTGNRFYRLFKP